MANARLAARQRVVDPTTIPFNRQCHSETSSSKAMHHPDQTLIGCLTFSMAGNQGFLWSVHGRVIKSGL